MKENFSSTLCLTIAILVLSACSAPQAPSTPVTRTPPPLSPTLEPTSSTSVKSINVNGRQISYICFGEGTPTVVLDSNHDMDWLYWDKVLQKVAPHTRICAYNRAGLGESDPAPTPRTSLDMAIDLHNLLISAGLAGPYILVGHAAGGLNALVYANQYPQDVVGMVLADPNNPDLVQRMLEYLPPESASEPSEVAICRRNLEDFYEFWISSKNPEGWDLPSSFEQVRAISSLGNLPLIVITDILDNACTGELDEKEDQIFINLLAEYAALSTNGTQIITKSSGHMLPQNNPDAIIDAILQVLEQARSK